jgi:hypothetical protein
MFTETTIKTYYQAFFSGKSNLLNKKPAILTEQPEVVDVSPDGGIRCKFDGLCCIFDYQVTIFRDGYGMHECWRQAGGNTNASPSLRLAY